MLLNLIPKLGFSKYIIIITGISIISLILSILYIKRLSGENAVLQASISRQEAQISSLKDDISTQKARYESSLKILNERDNNIKKLLEQNKDNKKSIIKLKDSDEATHKYLNTRIPNDVYNFLLSFEGEN